MDTWLKELRFATRQLAKSPGYAAAAVVTLALGIGAISAVYSVADAVLLKPLPYRDAERLDLIRISIGEARRLASISAPELVDFRDQSRLYDDFAAFWIGTALVTVDSESHRVSSGWGTANLLPMLGFDPLAGRHFEAADEDPNAAPVVLLSHDLWQSRFGGDPSIVGETIEMGRPRTVVGVLPPDFEVLVRRTTGFYQAPDVWEPNTFWTDREVHWLRVIGRRRPGVTAEQAQAEMDAIAARLAAEHSEYAATGLAFHVVPLHEDLVGGARPALLALAGTVAFLLLVACANVAGMSLARAGSRGGEIAVRSALGASRGQLARQLLTENALVAVLGAALGLALARWGVDLLRALRPAQLPRLDDVAIDNRVLAVTAGVTILTLFASGLAAALHASRPDLRSGLHGAGRALSSRRRERTLKLFVVTEIAIALTLLIGAGLMIRTFDGLRRVDLGFTPERVLTFRLSLPGAYDTPDKRFALFAQARDEIAGLPGVEAAGGVNRLPFTGGFLTGHYAFDAETEEAFGRHEAEYRYVVPGFLETVGARLAAGRFLSDVDVRDGRKVVVVDEDLAQIAWPGESPLGQKVKAGLQDEPQWHEVVGVVAHLRQEELRGAERPQIFFPYDGDPAASFAVRAQGDLETLGTAVRARLGELDAMVPVDDLRPLASYVADVRADARFVLVLMGLFATIALVLAAVGLHAVVSFWVSERIPGLGLRLAVGARRRDILALVLRHAFTLAGLGIAAGLAAGLALTRTLESLLFNVSPTDPATFTGFAVLLLGVALGACFVPAWRASRVDPAETLRCE